MQKKISSLLLNVTRIIVLMKLLQLIVLFLQINFTVNNM